MRVFAALRETGNGTFRTCRDVQVESACGGSAEDVCSEGDGCGPPAKRLLAH